MAPEDLNKPLIVIVGPTASGKTALAIDIAKKHGGEIICADSRTVYIGMDVGTAKPTAIEQNAVRHWGIDLVEPDQPFTAAMFKRYAAAAVADIRQREKLPMVVGGTGLYVDSLLYDYEFSLPANDKIRKELGTKTKHELIEYCVKNNIELPADTENKRRLIRAIERKSMSEKRHSPLISNTFVVGIATDSITLRSRIQKRTEHIFQDDVVGEATLLGKKYGWKHEALTGNIYPLVHSYLENEINHGQLKEKFTTLDWRLAKRQMTWLRRNPHIEWCSLDVAADYINHVLASEHTL